MMQSQEQYNLLISIGQNVFFWVSMSCVQVARLLRWYNNNMRLSTFINFPLPFSSLSPYQRPHINLFGKISPSSKWIKKPVPFFLTKVNDKELPF